MQEQPVGQFTQPQPKKRKSKVFWILAIFIGSQIFIAIIGILVVLFFLDQIGVTGPGTAARDRREDEACTSVYYGAYKVDRIMSEKGYTNVRNQIFCSREAFSLNGGQSRSVSLLYLATDVKSDKDVIEADIASSLRALDPHGSAGEASSQFDIKLSGTKDSLVTIEYSLYTASIDPNNATGDPKTLDELTKYFSAYDISYVFTDTVSPDNLSTNGKSIYTANKSKTIEGIKFTKTVNDSTIGRLHCSINPLPADCIPIGDKYGSPAYVTFYVPDGNKVTMATIFFKDDTYSYSVGLLLPEAVNNTPESLEASKKGVTEILKAIHLDREKAH